MMKRMRFWMACAMAMWGSLGAASAKAEPAHTAQPAKYATKTPKLQLGTGVYVGTVTRFADRQGRIVKAEFTTDRGKILLVLL